MAHLPVRHRRWRYLVPALLLAAIALNRFGIIQGPRLVIVFVLLELAFTLYVLASIALAVRAYRRAARNGHQTGGQPTAYETAVAALQEVLPAGLAQFLAMEPFLYGDFLRFVLRRRERADGQPFGYAGSAVWKGMLAVLLILTPVEVMLWELLIPWTWLRVLLLVIAVWALVYFVGLYVSLRLRPHRVREDSVFLRYGHFTRAKLPLDAIASVSVLRRGMRPPKRGFGIVHAPDAVAYLPGTEEPRVAVRLGLPMLMGNVGEETQLVQELRVYVDEPQRFVEALDEAIRAYKRQASKSPPA